ncbi:MAG: phosphopantothenate/pantothenate synthetase [Candidatus Diapherotrites archaeon]|nr:phosphopantothenate/pantothenate synthetase [Candidatus Diapherotrites archaeon]
MIPKNHPRYNSLMQRHLIEEGIHKGITSMQGLIAQGRGETFDYLLKEKTSKYAEEAIHATAALLLLSIKPVISVNGNTTVLCSKELVELSNELKCSIEVNLFYRTKKREKLIEKEFLKFNKKILGAGKKIRLKGLTSNRGLVDVKGIYCADTVLVMLEDGDRTESLIKAGKKVIAVDLNPLSRTAQKASISITDNVLRVIPLLIKEIKKLKKKKTSELIKIVLKYNNEKNLINSINLLKKGI